MNPRFNGAGLFTIELPSDSVQDRVLYYLTIDFLGVIVPILVTFYCYLRTFLRFRSAYHNSLYRYDSRMSRAFLFSLIQMLCFAPGIVMDVVWLSKNIETPIVAKITVETLHRSWGFLNLLVYWFLRPGEDKDDEEAQNFEKYMKRLSMSFDQSF